MATFFQIKSHIMIFSCRSWNVHGLVGLCVETKHKILNYRPIMRVSITAQERVLWNENSIHSMHCDSFCKRIQTYNRKTGKKLRKKLQREKERTRDRQIDRTETKREERNAHVELNRTPSQIFIANLNWLQQIHIVMAQNGLSHIFKKKPF